MAMVGGLLQVVGLGLSIYGQIQQANAQKAAERDRQKQMQLDAMRKRRDIVRNMIMARATALQHAAFQGAMYGSGLQVATVRSLVEQVIRKSRSIRTSRSATTSSSRT